MNHTLYQLAYRNIKKYKQHYLFVSILIFFISLFFLSYSIVWDNHYEAEKQYHQETYGEWYLIAKCDGSQEEIDDYFQEYPDTVRYGLYEMQGFYENYMICYMSDEAGLLTKTELSSGRKPLNEHEIMISSTLQKEQNLELDQTLALSINEGKTQTYQIVGIVEKTQDLFPDIYTHIPEGTQTKVITNTDLVINEEKISFYDRDYNEYGYDVSVLATIAMNRQQVIILVEMMGLSCFSLIFLTATSLERRTQELALLRGIGMTTKQLFLMIIYEMIYTSFAGVLLGFIASFGVSYMIMLAFAQKLGYFVCVYDLGKILGYAFLLLICVVVSCIYPIFSSAKRSLSGAFNSNTFQYIQVRYRKLKKQTKSYLALRELKAYKKMTICVMVILSILIIYLTTSINPEKQMILFQNKDEETLFHYISWQPESEEEYYQVLAHQSSNMLEMRYYSMKDEIIWQDQTVFFHYSMTYVLDDVNVLDYCQIEGRVPQNKNEILICEDWNGLDILEKDDSYRTIGILSIGDDIIIHQQHYTVVGCIKPNKVLKQNDTVSLYYLPEGMIYILPEAENEIFHNQNFYRELRFFYETQEEKDTIIQMIAYYVESPYIIDSDSDSYVYISALFSNPELLILPSVVCLVFCYFFNKNQMMNHINDYALYRCIGMTKKDLFEKQIMKALWITLYAFLLQIFWIVVLDFYYQLIMLPWKEVLLTVLLVFIVQIIIYCLPLYHILKEDFMLSIKGKE